MRRATRIILPVLAVAGGLLVAVMLLRTPPEAERVKPTRQTPRVTVAVTKSGSGPAEIAAMGTVVPARRVTLQAEVAGRVVWQSAKLVPGGRFRRGELIARIDPRDLRLQVTQRRAAVERARVAQELERGMGRVARREWRSFRGAVGGADAGSALALRRPQMRAAAADLAAAKSALAKAKLDLSRTAIRAPFNALVVTESVEVGQLVSPQSVLASLVGTDTFWVRVSVPAARLDWLRLPSSDGHGGSRAVVSPAAARRSGVVVRLLPDLEPQGRMARLLVSVPEPLSGERPLLLGAYVKVRLEGQALTRTTALPRLALQSGDTVLVVDDDDRLARRRVTVAWRARDTIYVQPEGPASRPGARVVVGRVSGARDGMRVSPIEASAPPAARSQQTTTENKPVGRI